MAEPLLVIEPVGEAPALAAPAFTVDRPPQAVSASDDWTLQRLLGPVSVETFCRDYWSRHPLLVRGGGDVFFASLVTMPQIEELLAIPRVLEERMVSLRAKGESVSLAPASVGTIYERVREGASLQFRKMERFLSPQAALSRFYRDMLLALQHPGVSMSCFITPPGAELLGPHHDATDVFTLQLAGRKRWRLFHKVSAEAGDGYPPEALSAPVQDFVLAPGDVLYNPRGTVHEVVCEDALSFSIPIVIDPITWTIVLRHLADELGRRPEFLEALPAGTILREDVMSRLASAVATRAALIAEAAAALDVGSMVDAAATDFLRGLGAPAAAHLSRALGDAAITEQTLLATRHGGAWRVSVSEEKAILTVGGGDVLKGPSSIAPALRAIMSRREPIAAGELHATLSAPARIVLARRLVRLGALAPVDEPAVNPAAES